MFWALSPVNPQGAACSLRNLNRHLPDDRRFKMGFCANGASGWPGGCPSLSARASSPASRIYVSSTLLLRVRMSQKSSLPQVTRFVSKALPPDRIVPRTSPCGASGCRDDPARRHGLSFFARHDMLGWLVMHTNSAPLHSNLKMTQEICRDTDIKQGCLCRSTALEVTERSAD